jgi:hypothetical protein
VTIPLFLMNLISPFTVFSPYLCWDGRILEHYPLSNRSAISIIYLLSPKGFFNREFVKRPKSKYPHGCPSSLRLNVQDSYAGVPATTVCDIFNIF